MTGGTRALILETAVRLFERDGYDGTTMRAIATEAGLSPSNAYYWFRSKDDLVQAFYERIQEQHRAEVGRALEQGGSLAERLRAVEHAGLDVMAPYHSFGTAFLATALDPRGSASPFSAESAPARDLARSLFRDVVADARPAVPRKLAAILPDVLWVAHLGVTLFWVTDTSPDQQRTRELVDRSVALLAGMVKVARLPGAAAVVDQLGGLLETILPTGGQVDA